MGRYTFFSGPGHGWLMVPLAEIKGLDVSGYSYRDRDHAYLEEDCDASLFLRSRSLDWNSVDVVQIKDESKIRNLLRVGGDR